MPLEDTLLVEAPVRPADIAFISPGQAAAVKLTAYDFAVHGGLAGRVEDISADTIETRAAQSSQYQPSKLLVLFVISLFC